MLTSKLGIGSFAAVILCMFTLDAAAEEITMTAVDQNISCEEASTITSMAADDPNYISYLMRFNQCGLAEYNKKNPNDPVVGVGGYNEKEQKYFFDILPAKSLEQIGAVCVAAHSAGGSAIPEPNVAKVFGIYGEMACEEYIKGLVDNDPFVIVFPINYPSHKIMEKGFKVAIATTEQIVEDPKPEDILLPTVSVPTKVITEVLDDLFD